MENYIQQIEGTSLIKRSSRKLRHLALIKELQNLQNIVSDTVVRSKVGSTKTNRLYRWTSTCPISRFPRVFVTFLSTICRPSLASVKMRNRWRGYQTFFYSSLTTFSGPVQPLKGKPGAWKVLHSVYQTYFFRHWQDFPSWSNNRR
jgi:hypothetical protein